MTNHPITPPPALVEQWRRGGPADAAVNNAYERHIATQAARWGADQQLEQCVAWLDGYEHEGWAAEQMRNDCRRKPPSLKEQALAAQQRMWDGGVTHADWELIRRALEQLDD